MDFNLQIGETRTPKEIGEARSLRAPQLPAESGNLIPSQNSGFTSPTAGSPLQTHSPASHEVFFEVYYFLVHILDVLHWLA